MAGYSCLSRFGQDGYAKKLLIAEESGEEALLLGLICGGFNSRSCGSGLLNCGSLSNRLLRGGCLGNRCLNNRCFRGGILNYGSRLYSGCLGSSLSDGCLLCLYLCLDSSLLLGGESLSLLLFGKNYLVALVKKVVDGDAENKLKLNKLGYLGVGLTGFPLVDCLSGYAYCTCKLVLGKTLKLSEFHEFFFECHD